MPRKVTYGAACSLDLCIARADFSDDWILHTREASDVMRDDWSAIRWAEASSRALSSRPS